MLTSSRHSSRLNRSTIGVHDSIVNKCSSWCCWCCSWRTSWRCIRCSIIMPRWRHCRQLQSRCCGFSCWDATASSRTVLADCRPPPGKIVSVSVFVTLSTTVIFYFANNNNINQEYEGMNLTRPNFTSTADRWKIIISKLISPITVIVVDYWFVNSLHTHYAISSCHGGESTLDLCHTLCDKLLPWWWKYSVWTCVTHYAISSCHGGESTLSGFVSHIMR